MAIFPKIRKPTILNELSPKNLLKHDNNRQTDAKLVRVTQLKSS